MYSVSRHSLVSIDHDHTAVLFVSCGAKGPVLVMAFSPGKIDISNPVLRAHARRLGVEQVALAPVLNDVCSISLKFLSLTYPELTQVGRFIS